MKRRTRLQAESSHCETFEIARPVGLGHGTPAGGRHGIAINDNCGGRRPCTAVSDAGRQAGRNFGRDG